MTAYVHLLAKCAKAFFKQLRKRRAHFHNARGIENRREVRMKKSAFEMMNTALQKVRWNKSAPAALKKVFNRQLKKLSLQRLRKMGLISLRLKEIAMILAKCNKNLKFPLNPTLIRLLRLLLHPLQAWHKLIHVLFPKLL